MHCWQQLPLFDVLLEVTQARLGGLEVLDVDAVSLNVVIDQLLFGGHDVCGKRLFSVDSAVQEANVLNLADVEVGLKFTRPFRECR